MEIFIVSQYDRNLDLDSIADTMWRFSFTTLAAAKFAAEEDMWEKFCEEWEESVEFDFDEEDVPAPTAFLHWVTYPDDSVVTAWEWPNDADGYEFSIQRTELK